MSTSISLKKKAAYLSLIVGVLMFLSKSTAYLITGSAAIFSDAAESVVHVLATSMALYSIILSSKPPDDSHLYGHGNIEFFSAGIEGFLILTAAIFIIYTSILDIIHGPDLKQLNVGIIVVSAAGAINLLLGNYLVKMGKKTHSLTLVADGKHVLTDSYTSIGVIVGVLLVMITGFQLFDPIFAIAVALNILFTGYKLIRESIGGLMNETDPGLLNKLVYELTKIRKNYWIDLHELRFWRSGDMIFLDFHLILPYYFTIEKSHKEEKEIEEKMAVQFPNMQIKIHFDYCITELCKYCGYADCTVRKEAKTIPFELNSEKMTGYPIYRVK
jgi:cation diffusion facilitator family transporter